MTEWNKYQRAFFDELATGDGNVALVARAGTGKTTSIVGGLAHLAGVALLCAFNKRIATELGRRVESRADVSTLHALGFATVRRYWRRVQIDDRKDRRHAERAVLDASIVDEKGRPNREYVTRVVQLASLAKNTLAETIEAVEQLAIDHDLDEPSFDPPIKADVLAGLAVEALGRQLEDVDACSFDDMLWLPVRYGLEPKAVYRAVIVDETQDMNRAQLWLAQRHLDEGGRLVVVGDDRQAIYGWRGADADAMAFMISALDAKVLKLPLTYRCARKIVELAQRIVPDLEHAPNAPDGEVHYVARLVLVRDAKPGDYVLSRSNAALVSAALGLIRAGKRATIQGRDLATTLVRMIEQSKATDLASLETWLEAYLAEQAALLLAQGREDRYDEVADRVGCIRELARDAATIADVRDKVFWLCSDDPNRDSIVCSSIHKAKGDERERVWILARTLDPRRNETKAKRRERENLKYVAITRAKSWLAFVED